MAIMINPGTGPVDGTRKQALANVLKLVEDAGVELSRPPEGGAAGDDGRYPFTLRVVGRVRPVEVDMPGLPLERVRYTGAPQDPFAFPRLYVDGSSWLWCIAVNILKRGE